MGILRDCTTKNIFQTHSIEYALVEKQVLEGLKHGNDVLSEIHKETSVEAVEKLMDDTADAIAYQNVRIKEKKMTFDILQ